MSKEKILEFTAAIRGYHYYKRYWQPKEAEKLDCLHEVDNPFDVFAIKTGNSDKNITGHLPREISRVTKFLLDRGAVVYAELTSTNYRRSPLMQGGLEIQCKITVKLHATVKNHMLLDRYKQLVNELYCEPKGEVIMGSFLVNTQLPPSTLLPLPGPSSSSQPKKKKARKDDNEGVAIRKFFVAKEKVSNKQEKEKNDILEISDSDSD